MNKFKLFIKKAGTIYSYTHPENYDEVVLNIGPKEGNYFSSIGYELKEVVNGYYYSTLNKIDDDSFLCTGIIIELRVDENKPNFYHFSVDNVKPHTITVILPLKNEIIIKDYEIAGLKKYFKDKLNLKEDIIFNSFPSYRSGFHHESQVNLFNGDYLEYQIIEEPNKIIRKLLSNKTINDKDLSLIDDFNIFNDKKNVDKSKLIDFLTRIGIRKNVSSTGISFYFKENNFIFPINLNQIKDLLIEISRKERMEGVVVSFLENKSSQFFMDLKRVGNITEPEGILFKNGFFSGEKFFEKYDENDLIQANESLSMSRFFDLSGGNFIGNAYNFIKDLSRNDNDEIDEERFDIFCKIIGYYLYPKKELTNAVAFVITDYNEDIIKTSANGGNGKSTFIQLLKMYRNTIIKDGKKFKANDKFALSSVDESNKILAFDDIKEGFDVGDLYNMVTSDMEIEGKFDNSISIPFNLSPKIIITTNKPFPLRDNSDQRRFKQIEVSNYFKKTFVINKYGENIFTRNEEINKTDLFVCHCLTRFLSDKYFHVKIKNNQNTERNKLIIEAGTKIIEFLDDVFSDIDSGFVKLLDKLGNEYILIHKGKLIYNSLLDLFLSKKNNEISSTKFYSYVDRYVALKFYSGDLNKVIRTRTNLYGQGNKFVIDLPK